MVTSEYYVFVTPTTHRVPPCTERFVRYSDEDSLRGHLGFRSTFAFSGAVVKRVLQQRSFRQLGPTDCGSRVVLVDFDSQPLAARAFERRLLDAGVAHSVWDSGNRSVHFHVATEWTTGTDLPARHAAWVREWAPLADPTVYKPTSLFRLSGTWHEKNPGRRKSLLRQAEGEPTKLPLTTTARPRAAVSTAGDPELAQLKLRYALSDSFGVGGRRVHAWRVATLCCDAGLDQQRAVEIVDEWNLKCCSPPLDLATVEQKVAEAYLQRSYSVSY